MICSEKIYSITRLHFVESDIKIQRTDEPNHIKKRHVFKLFYVGKTESQPTINTKPIMNRKRDFRFQPRSKCGI